MLILLPPSEGKTTPVAGKPLDLTSLSLPDLTPARERMLDTLVALSARKDAADVLGVGKTLADEVLRNAALLRSPTANASAIYTGVLYEALDFASLSVSARRRANRHVAIASSLFGLVRPSDKIPAYRLSGDVALANVGVVSTYWARHLSPVADAVFGSGLVVDLRSGTYAKFWKPTAPTVSVVSVRVLHEVGGVRKVVSHFNKASKGRIVRAVLEDGGVPKTAAAFADQLRDLGWKVEDGPRQSTLDVVVETL